MEPPAKRARASSPSEEDPSGGLLCTSSMAGVELAPELSTAKVPAHTPGTSAPPSAAAAPAKCVAGAGNGAGAAGDAASGAPAPSAAAKDLCAARKCVEWAPINPAYQSSGADDPATAEEAEEYVRQCYRRWVAKRPEDPMWLPTNAPRFERASAKYQDELVRLTRTRAHSAHTAAYNCTLKDFPLPKKVQHFGAIPGVKPGFELLNKAHAAAIGVHRQIYKGISCKKEGGEFGPAESIAISGGYKDDEDNGTTIWYTGDGGQNDKREQFYNQRLRPFKTLAGNIGIAMNCEGDLPIRVMRKKESTSGMPDSYVYDGLYRVVQWKRCISDGGPAVIKFKMERLATETGAVSKAVTFNRKSSNRGRMLAGAAVHGHGKTTLVEQRKRRMLARSSPSVLDTDISRGKDAPWQVCCFNGENAEKLPEHFTYITRSEPVGAAVELLRDFEAEADSLAEQRRHAVLAEAAERAARKKSKAEASAATTVVDASIAPTAAPAAAAVDGAAAIDAPVLAQQPQEISIGAAAVAHGPHTSPPAVSADAATVAVSTAASGTDAAAPDEHMQSECMLMNTCPLTQEPRFPYNRDRCLIEVCDAVYECGAECKGGLKCMLKLVQHGLPRDLEVFMTKDRGWGVRCWHKILAGDFISEYLGEILTSEEADLRDNDEYFFDLQVVPLDSRGAQGAISQGKSEFLIDGRVRGNITRFINHSCVPNLIVQCVFVGKQKLPRICLFACRDIDPGTELTYDYAQEHSGASAFDCKCGAPGCKNAPPDTLAPMHTGSSDGSGADASSSSSPGKVKPAADATAAVMASEDKAQAPAELQYKSAQACMVSIGMKMEQRAVAKQLLAVCGGNGQVAARLLQEEMGQAIDADGSL